jgi:uncharacterized protein (TIGR02646 family)
MIHVARTSKPVSLIQNETNWRNELAAAIRSKDQRRISAASSKYRRSDIKKALEVMFSGKCAYCESEILSVSYGHIEHFKPKSKYPSKAFAWANLLLACEKCNSSEHKGAKFPTARCGGPLVDPTAEDPADFFEFAYDRSTRLATIIPKNTRGKTTADLFGLNSRKSLIKRRSELIRKLIVISQSSDREAREIIDYARSVRGEYSAWVNRIIPKP